VRDRQTRVIAKHFLSVKSAAIHITTLNASTLILDLVATEPKNNVSLPNQIPNRPVYRECTGQWNKPSLAKLTILDSALREALRLTSGGGTWTPQRKVVAKDGVSLPD